MGPREDSPGSRETFTGRPGPQGPLQAPQYSYLNGFYLLLSSRGLDSQGKGKEQALPPRRESWLGQRVVTLPIGIACPLASCSPLASGRNNQVGVGVFIP